MTILPRAIFSTSDWNKMYPTEDYKTYFDNRKTESGKEANQNEPQLKRVNTLTVHYLLNSPKIKEAAITDWITKNPERLNAPDKENHELTALHVATMQGKVSVVRAILDTWKKAKTLEQNIDAKDAYGWSALFHATISSQEIVTLLKEYGASSKLKTNSNLGLDEINEMLSRDVKSRSIQRVSFKEKEGKLTPLARLSDEELFLKTGLKQYRDVSFVPDNQLKYFWQWCDSSYAHTDVELFQSKAEFYIAPCQELEGNAHPMELIAGKDMPQGAFVEEYSGAFRESFKTKKVEETFLNYKDEYYFQPVDAEEVGNLVRFANMGWPNAAIINVKNEGSSHVCLYIINSQGVKKDEPIRLNYGLGSLFLQFLGSIQLLGRDEMHLFFKDSLARKLREYFELSGVEQENLKKFIKSTELAEKIIFPLSCPLALLDLHFNRIIMANSWLKLDLYKSPIPIFYKWKKERVIYSNYVISLLNFLVKLDEKIGENSIIKDKIKDWFEKQKGKLSVLKIVKGLHLIYKQLNTNVESVDLLKNLSTDLKDYDYFTDEDHPLSRMNTIKDLVETQLPKAGSKEKFIGQMHTILEFYEKRDGKDSELYDYHLSILKYLESK